MQNFTNFTKIIPVNDKLLCLNCRMFRISNLHSRKTKHLGTNLPSMTYRQMSWRGDVWVNVVIFNHWNRCSPWCSPNKCYKTDRSPDDSRCLSRPVATASKAVCCRERQTWIRSLSLCSFSPSSHRHIVEGSIRYATESQRTKVSITCKLWIWMEAIERCTISPGM